MTVVNLNDRDNLRITLKQFHKERKSLIRGESTIQSQIQLLNKSKSELQKEFRSFQDTNQLILKNMMRVNEEIKHFEGLVEFEENRKALINNEIWDKDAKIFDTEYKIKVIEILSKSQDAQ